MNGKYKISAIIAAAGSGQRLQSAIPKQYIDINGESSLERSIKAFYNNSMIDKICVVISPEHISLFNNIKARFDDRLIYTKGGEFRQESISSGLESLQEFSPDIVLIHDAARPFVSQKIINDVIDGVIQNKVALPAVNVIDTIKIAENNIVKETLPRQNLYSAQTPQGFEYRLICNLHKKYKGQNLSDDMALAEKDDIKVKMVAGDHANYKITTVEDMERAKMAVGKMVRCGNGFDVHRFEEGDSIILCGIKIPFNKKLKGHSDADCGWHAITDAMLGAAGLGDIGEHFPDSDPQWRGADSGIFLKHSAKLVQDMGGSISNVDLTIICEVPKLQAFKQSMKENTAKILGMSASQVNIKATTTEKLGFLGRGEGLASLANVTIVI